MRERMLIIGVGCLLDLLFGDPHFLWHPVQGIGWLIEKTEKMLRKIFSISPEPEADKGKKRVAGAFLVLVVLFLTLGIVWGLLKLAGLVHTRFKNCSFLRPVLSDACHEVFKDREHEGI